MAKYVFYASTGYVGADQQEVVEIPDEELEGLTDREKEKVVQEHFDSWLGNNVELSFWEADEDEE